MAAGRNDIVEEIPNIRRFARMLCKGDSVAADDLVQETLLRALRSADGFAGDASVRTWLGTIMLNVLRSDKRRAARWRDHAETMPVEEPSQPARQVQRLEVKDALAVLADLPEEQRVPIALVATGQMTYAEAAAALNVRLGTLMSRIARGRAVMRAKLDGGAKPGLTAAQKRSAG